MRNFPNKKTQVQRDAELAKALDELEKTAYPSCNFLTCYFPIRPELAAGIEQFIPEYPEIRQNKTNLSCLELVGDWTRLIYSHVYNNGTKAESIEMIDRLTVDRCISSEVTRSLNSRMEKLYYTSITVSMLHRFNMETPSFLEEIYREESLKNDLPPLTFKGVLLHVLGAKSCNPCAHVFPGKTS